MERDDKSIDELNEVWAPERPYLLRVAQRVLEGRDGAEDVVQEALGRLVRADAISDVRGWLTVVVRNIAIDRVRSAHSRHETGGDQALGIAAGGVDPVDRVTLDDQVQRALAIVLDRLSPPERTAFVLHDIFGFSFIEVGQIVGRTPAACRQLASRARRSIRSDSPALTPASPASPTSPDWPLCSRAAGSRRPLDATRSVVACCSCSGRARNGAWCRSASRIARP